MTMERYKLDTVVVGAGVVGLAIAKVLSEAGRSVWLLDKEESFGRHTSSRNSEVIHAGIYYPSNSLKAELCVRGKALLYEYLKARQLPYSQCGKLIVASDAEQLGRLEMIESQARLNGVRDLKHLSQKSLNDSTPALSALGALLSPSTGVVDSHAYMQSLLHDAEIHGATFLPNTEAVLRGIAPRRFELELVGQNVLVECSQLVNAAGLYATSFLNGLSQFPPACLPEPVYAKGSYFSYSGKVPFKQLIYPVPEEGGLGVHLTLDLAGAARFGPDVEWCSELGASDLDTFDYSVSETKKEAFIDRIRAYWPRIEPAKLHTDYSGLRPKIRINDVISNDFCVQFEQEHGIAGLVSLFGIESPGLTASLAIAELVRSKLN